MTRQRYNLTESINRILRLFENKAVPTDAPDSVTPEVLSIEEAASDLAELLARSLPGEAATLPSAITVPPTSISAATTSARGVVELATDAEVLASTDAERSVVPLMNM